MKFADSYKQHSTNPLVHHRPVLENPAYSTTVMRSMRKLLQKWAWGTKDTRNVVTYN